MKAFLTACVFLSLTVSAPAVVITGQSVFNSSPGGILANWTHSFSTGPAGVNITQIVITLNPNLFFDTSAAAPGFLTMQDVGTSSDGGTGFTGFSASGAALNGGTIVTLSFGNFNVGETYEHVGDVDEAVTLQDCSGLGSIALAGCLLNNTVATTDGSLVSGAEFAGSKVDVTFGGPLLASPVTLTGIFAATGANVATATFTGDVTLVPEPATIFLSGAALLALGLRRR